MRKGMLDIVAVIVLLLVLVVIMGVAWFFLSAQFESYTTKVIAANIGSATCAGRSATLTINNIGTTEIQVAQPAPSFSTLGNIIPNAGFEDDSNGNGKPDYWEGVEKEMHADIVLVSDLSNSMSDCMDNQTITPDGTTVLLMHFDDPNNPGKDSSGWGNNGIVQGATASWTPDGRFGGAIHLIYKDNVTIPFNDSITNFTAMTLEAWVKFDDVNTRSSIINNWNAYNGKLNYELMMQDGNALMLFKTSIEWGGGNPWSGVEKFHFIPDVWYHVAATWSGGSMKLYINGTLLTNHYQSVFNEPIYNTQSITIGSRDWVSVHGSVDEVAIYNRVLSGGEIASHAKVMKSSAGACPSDGKPDMPSWCRSETSLCPPTDAGLPDESYLMQYNQPSFSVQTFGVAGESANPSASCNPPVLSTSNRYCYDNGLTYRQTLYQPCDWIDRTNQANDACTPIGRTVRGTDYASTRYDRYPTFSCNSDEVNNGYAECEWKLRTDYAASSCSSTERLDYNMSWSSLWKPECIQPQERDTGERSFGTYECQESQCRNGWTQCSQCNSCSGSDVCCCDGSTALKRCENMSDSCCDSRQCVKLRDYCCVVNVECCVGENMCKPSTKTSPPGSSCAPGISGVPSIANNCGSGSISLCTAQGGSCYYCSSVAIRLLKKLDTAFTESVFDNAPRNARISTVYYGTEAEQSPDILRDYTGEDAIKGRISGYSAARGETCIACAIAKANETLKGSAADKKYIVLMSDGEANVRDGFATADRNGDTVVDAEDDAIARACDAASYGVVFYTIGFGKESGADTLGRIAQCSAGGEYFQGTNPDELTNIYAYISQTVSNSGFSTEQKAYGERSLLVNNALKPPSATSAYFDVKPSGGALFNLSFYRKLSLKPGFRFNVSITFYDNMLAQLGNPVVREYGPSPVEDTAMSKDSLPQFPIPDNAAKAVIRVAFDKLIASGTDPTSSVMIDDIYMGPEITCVRESGGYRCGDLFVTKTSQDGDVYPYFNGPVISPKGAVTFKDANCQGRCQYAISTPANTINAEVGC